MPRLTLRPCRAGETLPLSFCPLIGQRAHILDGQGAAPALLPRPAAGTFLSLEGQKIMQVESYAPFLPEGRLHSEILPVARALIDIEGGPCGLNLQKEGVSLAVVTLSDKGFAGERVDESGPAIQQALSKELPLSFTRFHLLADEQGPLRSLFSFLAFQERFDLVVSTGGTGVGPRDITLDAAKRLFDFELPGFAVAMTQASLKVTQKAVISRCCAGVMGGSLVLCLPGSKKAVRENLEAVAGALGHAIEKLHGDQSDCARG